MYETPYMVFVEHQKKEVIVAVRGTESLWDALADIQLKLKDLQDSIPTKIPGDRFYTYKGFYMCAKAIKQLLDQKQTLETLFKKYPDYSLVVIGHSLGAGACAILALWLYDKYPTLKCYPYSPPGCVFSENAAKFCESFMTSVILGEDVIPRLSLPNLAKMKQETVRRAVLIQQNKTLILCNGVFRCFFGCGPFLDDKVHMKDEDVEKEKGNMPTDVRRFWDNYISHSKGQAPADPIFIPGKIIFVYDANKQPGQSETSSFNKLAYTAQWAQKEDFNEILVSMSMVGNHFPDAVKSGLDHALKKAKGLPDVE